MKKALGCRRRKKVAAVWRIWIEGQRGINQLKFDVGSHMWTCHNSVKVNE